MPPSQYFFSFVIFFSLLHSSMLNYQSLPSIILIKITACLQFHLFGPPIDNFLAELSILSYKLVESPSRSLP